MRNTHANFGCRLHRHTLKHANHISPGPKQSEMCTQMELHQCACAPMARRDCNESPINDQNRGWVAKYEIRVLEATHLKGLKPITSLHHVIVCTGNRGIATEHKTCDHENFNRTRLESLNVWTSTYRGFLNFEQPASVVINSLAFGLWS
jgi:hypothetical protein